MRRRVRWVPLAAATSAIAVGAMGLLECTSAPPAGVLTPDATTTAPDDVAAPTDGGDATPLCPGRGTPDPRVSAVFPRLRADFTRQLITDPRGLLYGAASSRPCSQDLRFPGGLAYRFDLEKAITPKVPLEAGPDAQPRDPRSSSVLCVAPDNSWQAIGLAIAPGGKDLAIGGTSLRGPLTASVVSLDDPSWDTPALITRPAADRWGAYADPDGGRFPGQRAHAIAWDGDRLRVVGHNGRGAGLSVLFEPRAPTDGGTEAYTSTGLEEPRVRALHAVLALADGTSLAAGTSAAGKLALLRLTRDNTPDTTYGAGGLVEAGDVGVLGAGLAHDSVGRVVVVWSGEKGATWLRRLGADGQLDPARPAVPIPLFNTAGRRLDFATDAVGGVYVGGLYGNDGGPVGTGFVRVTDRDALDTDLSAAGAIADIPTPSSSTPSPVRVFLAAAPTIEPCKGWLFAFVKTFADYTDPNATEGDGHGYVFVP